MEKMVYLRYNSTTVIINNINIGSNNILESVIFHPGEIWFDELGVIRQFSMRFDDNTIGNFFLMPNDNKQNKYMISLTRDLGEFGVKMVANSLFSGGALIVNLAKFFFEKYGKLAITDLLLDRPKNLAYIALENREVVFYDSLNINRAICLNELLFFIRNDFSYHVNCLISRDMKNWRNAIIYPKNVTDMYFSNGQNGGYLIIYTNDKPGKTYLVYAQNYYYIYWDSKSNIWDLRSE